MEVREKAKEKYRIEINKESYTVKIKNKERNE